jgi:hypothetical protein
MTTVRSSSARRITPGHGTAVSGVLGGICLAAAAFTAVGIAKAPSAAADSTDTLRTAVAAARGSACGPLHSNPMVEQAAALINGTTDKWIDHTARAAPETDALSVLKDLGYGGRKAAILSGAATTDGDAIKGVLLQGYSKIPDCSYADFGVSVMYNASKDMTLTTIVLAG